MQTTYNVYLADEAAYGVISDVADHAEAILLVKEELVASGAGWSEPVLTVINGGKV